MALLGTFWTIRGENARVIAIAGAVETAFEGWVPSDDEVESAVAAAAMLVMNAMPGDMPDAHVSRALLAAYAERSSEPRTRAVVTVLSAQDADDPEATLTRLDTIGRGADRTAAMMARMWAAHYRENDGDPEAAIAEATAGLALARADLDGPWMGAGLRTMVASLYAQLGRYPEAAEHARAALGDLDLLEAVDDSVQVRSLLAVDAMNAGDLRAAEQLMDEIDELSQRRSRGDFGGALGTGPTRAELALTRGDVAEGLRLYRVALQTVREIRYPGFGLAPGTEPWVLFVSSAAVAAHARHGEAGRDGADLAADLLATLPVVLGAERQQIDFPVTGVVMFALGAWGLFQAAFDPRAAVTLVVLAERFSYARYTVFLALEPVLAEAERLAPGLAAELRASYGERHGPSLLEEARAVVERLTGG